MIKKIAIVRLSAMGDIIHSMTALQFIKAKYPNIQIDWFVEEVFAGVLENNPHVDNIIRLNLKSIKKNRFEIFNQIKLVSSFRKNSYDLVIDTQGLLKSAIVARLLGEKRAGFCKNSTREKIASCFYNKKISISYDKNVIDRNCYLISKALDFEITKDEIVNKEPFLFFKDESGIIYDYLEKDRKNILFVVGASWPSKIYPKEKFAKIASSLNENFLIAWGSEQEKEMAKFIEQNSNAKVLPKLDLNSLKALISKVDLTIGNDTGPTHISWALNIPTITIFGNTPAYRNTYETKISKIVKSKSIVNPYKIDKNDFSIQDIDEEEIIKIAKELLSVQKN